MYTDKEIDLGFAAGDLLRDGFTDYQEGLELRAVRRFGTARAIYEYFEDPEMIKLVNLFLGKIDLSDEETRFWYENGRGKAEFLIGLVNFGEEFIEQKIRESKSIEDNLQGGGNVCE